MRWEEIELTTEHEGVNSSSEALQVAEDLSRSVKQGNLNFGMCLISCPVEAQKLLGSNLRKGGWQVGSVSRRSELLTASCSWHYSLTQYHVASLEPASPLSTGLVAGQSLAVDLVLASLLPLTLCSLASRPQPRSQPPTT